MKIKKNFKEFEDLDKELKYIDTHMLVIGVLSDDKVEGVSVKEYSMYVEFGTLFIPARPFFRSSTQSSKATAEINGRLKDEFSQVIIGKKTGKQAFNSIGLFVKGKIQLSIKKGNWVRNSPSTVAKKGKNNPLIDTGTLIKSIDYEIRKK